MDDFLNSKIIDTHTLIPIRETSNGIKIRMGREYNPWAFTNGDKARLLLNMIAHYLITLPKGATPTVIGGMSSGSPYQPMCAVTCHALTAGSSFEVNNIFCNASHSAKGKEYLEIAEEFGAIHHNEGINGQGKGLQTKIKAFAATIPNSMYVPYAITPDINLGEEYFADMYYVGSKQVRALEGSGIKKIFIPFGSANSSTSIIYGLNKFWDYHEIEEVVFVCVAANAERQRAVLESNLEHIFNADTDVTFKTMFSKSGNLFDGDVEGMDTKIKFTFIDTSKEKVKLGKLCWDYSNKQHEEFEVDGVTYDHHPTYEGKAWAKIREIMPDELTKPENLFWEVGGPLLRDVLK